MIAQASDILRAAMGYAIAGHVNFTVGSVIGVSPEALGMWRKTKGPEDAWRQVATAVMRNVMALKELNELLTTLMPGYPQILGAPGAHPMPGAAGAAPGGPGVAGGGAPAVPLAAPPLGNMVLAPYQAPAGVAGGPGNAAPPPMGVPVQQRPAPTMAPKDILKYLTKTGAKVMAPLFHEAWTICAPLRQTYVCLGLICFRLLPTVVLGTLLLGGLALLAGIILDPHKLVQLVAYCLAAIPKIAGNAAMAVAEETCTQMFDMKTPEVFGNHCQYEGTTADAQTSFSQSSAPFAHNIANAPAGPPPTTPSQGQFLALSSAAVGWVLGRLAWNVGGANAN